MNALRLALIPLALCLFGCDSNVERFSTTTSVTTGAIQVKSIPDPKSSLSFRDNDEFASSVIKVARVTDVQELGGGTCLVYVPSNGPRGKYGILANCNLNLDKGASIYYRYGSSLFGDSWETYPIAISEAEAQALENHGWRILGTKAFGSALNGSPRPVIPVKN